MTSELENRFYEAFGIEPQQEITDRILLELICLLDFDTRCDNVETLKEKVLTDLHSLLSYMRQVHHIPDKENDIYKQVRALFGLESEARI